MHAILKAIAGGQIAAQCVAVVSSRADAAGLAIAENFGVPCYVVNTQQQLSSSALDSALLDILATKVGAEVIALAGFMHILGAEIVNRYYGCMLNIHPALLPHYKGLNTHQRVLDDQQSEHGCSVHFVSKDVDAGAIIMQARITVNKNDTTSTLAQRVLHYEHLIYPQSLALLCADRLSVQGRQCLLDGHPLLEPLQPYNNSI